MNCSEFIVKIDKKINRHLTRDFYHKPIEITLLRTILKAIKNDNKDRNNLRNGVL